MSTQDQLPSSRFSLTPLLSRMGRARRAVQYCGLTSAMILFLTGAIAAQAGGLYLPENGGPINGTAQAGSAAIARDAETAWLNPAGMTRLESPALLFSVMPFNMSLDFSSSSDTTASGSEGGNQGGWLLGAALYLAMPVSDRVWLGFSATSPGGVALDPSDDWAGRTWMTKTALIALNFEPSIGVKLNDQWSVGAGLDVQYLTFSQDLRGPLAGTPLNIDGDSWDLGFSLSALWAPSKSTRLGLRYHSQVSHSLAGDLTVNASRPISTSFTLPMSLTLSAYHELNATLALVADAGWTDWSAFDSNVISFDNSGNSTELARNFKDTWNFGVGVHYNATQQWMLLAGASYVSSAVADADRTPDLPVDEQVRLSIGAEYDLSDHWTIGANYTFAWLGDNRIDQTQPITGRLAGDYDATLHLIGLYAQITF